MYYVKILYLGEYLSILNPILQLPIMIIIMMVLFYIKRLFQFRFIKNKKKEKKMTAKLNNNLIFILISYAKLKIKNTNLIVI